MNPFSPDNHVKVRPLHNPKPRVLKYSECRIEPDQWHYFQEYYSDGTRIPKDTVFYVVYYDGGSRKLTINEQDHFLFSLCGELTLK